MMKIFMLFIVLNSFVFAKECYFNKVDKICFYKYFNKSSIHDFKADEEYYKSENDRIYTFDKTIEVRFNSIGAIFTILNNFELEFVDKIQKEVYLFKVDDRKNYFSTISRLNRLKTVMKARPHMRRKYTNSYFRAKIEAKKARLNAILNKNKQR